MAPMGRAVPLQGVSEIMQADAAARARLSSALYRVDDLSYLSRCSRQSHRRWVRGSLAALVTFVGIALSGAAFAQQAPAGIKIETLLKTDNA
jgi:hypothetical protein